MNRPILNFSAAALLALAGTLVISRTLSDRSDDAENPESTARNPRLIDSRSDSLDEALDRAPARTRRREGGNEGIMGDEARHLLNELDRLQHALLSGDREVPRREFTNGIYKFMEAGGSAEQVLAFLDRFALAGNIQSPGDHDFSRIVAYAASRLGKKDGELVAAWIDSHVGDPAFDTDQLAYSAARSWIAVDSRSASEWLDSHAPEFDDNQVRSLLAKWDPSDRAGCLDWIDEKIATGSDLISGDAISRLTADWALDDPLAARAWVGTLPEELQVVGYRQIASTWPEDQLEEALVWISDHAGDPAFDSAHANLSARRASDDPLGALQLANTVVDTAVRRTAVFGAARHYLAQDPAAAAAWLEANGHGNLLRLLTRGQGS